MSNERPSGVKAEQVARATLPSLIEGGYGGGDGREGREPHDHWGGEGGVESYIPLLAYTCRSGAPSAVVRP